MKKYLLLAVLVCTPLLGGARSLELPAEEINYTHGTTVPLRSPPAKPTNAPQEEPRPGGTATESLVSLALPSPGVTVPPPIKIYYPAGEIRIPILLYHHIADLEKASRYAVSPKDFEKQISSLRSWGYTAISLSQLVQTIEQGGDLPLRPVVITFDDGYRDLYKNALPIMERYGYTGTAYVIVKYIGGGGYMNAKQLKELVDRGWEVGSHSQTHANLRRIKSQQVEKEIFTSKKALEELLSIPVLSFSYPYGSATPALLKLVQQAGYKYGVGVGTSSRHTLKSRYYLSRLEVQGGYDLVEFASLLR